MTTAPGPATQAATLTAQQAPAQPSELVVRRANLLRALSAVPGWLGLADSLSIPTGGDLFQEAAALTTDQHYRLMSQVEPRLKPEPLENGAFRPVLGPSDVGVYPVLTPAQRQQLADRAISVGRIEVAASGPFHLRGTGFVVGPDLVATNCHVLESIGSLDGGQWRFSNDTRIDFGEGPTHDDTLEYRVVGVRAMSHTAGLDVALLDVEATSISGGLPLPAALPFRQSALAYDWALSGLPIALVGYPNLDGATSNLRDLAKTGAYAKIFAPGLAVGGLRLAGVDVIAHIAGTAEGNSGSPIFDLDAFEVIAVHNCCLGTPASSLQGLACSQITVAQEAQNQAVASWAAAGDETIGPFLRRDVPAR